MKRIIILTFLFIIAFSACNKDDNKTNPEPQATVLNYFQLDVGNYWVYERSGCDSTWTDCQTISVDTNYVTKDTSINGNKYYKIEGQKLFNSSAVFVRDSLNYIVDHHGNIWFSNTDFDLKFNEDYVVIDNDTLYHWYNKMFPDSVIFEVPLGEFCCLDNRLSFFRKKENFQWEFNSHKAYSKNVGLVYESSMFASSTGGYKRELLQTNILHAVLE